MARRSKGVEGWDCCSYRAVPHRRGLSHVAPSFTSPRGRDRPTGPGEGLRTIRFCEGGSALYSAPSLTPHPPAFGRRPLPLGEVKKFGQAELFQMRFPPPCGEGEDGAVIVRSLRPSQIDLQHAYPARDSLIVHIAERFLVFLHKDFYTRFRHDRISKCRKQTKKF